MKKIILFLFIPFFLFADPFLYQKYSIDGYVRKVLKLTTAKDTCDILKLKYPKHSTTWYVIDGYVVDLYGGMDNYNSTCIEKTYPLNFKYRSLRCDSNPHFQDEGYMSALINDDFCKDKPGCIFLSDAGYWYCKDDDLIICPPGKDYSKENNKCIGTSDCPSGQFEIDGYCTDLNSYLLNSLKGEDLDYYKNHCKIVNDEISFSGGKICDSRLICDGETVRTVQVSCGSSSDSNDTVVCSSDQDIVIQGDNVTCVDKNLTLPVNNSDNNSSINSENQNNNPNSNSQESTDDGSNNQNNTDGSNGSSGSVSNESNSSNNVDCCSYYKSGHGQWTSVNGCLEYTVPETGQKCRIKDDGLKCYECNSGSSSDSNSSGSINDIVTKINQTNSRLDKINNTLNDIIDLKPSHTPDGNLSSDEVSIFSGFTDTISNTKKALGDLTDSANKLKDLISNPKKFTLFNDNNTVTCPIVTNIYHNEISVDICKFIYPYKPILELFFTLIFSLYVVFYFFDVILKGGNR